MAFIPMFASAQSSVTFSYDSSGNRVSRQLYIGSKSRKNTQQTTAIDNYSGKKVIVKPIPSEGKVKIEIPGLTKADKCILRVYDLTGKLLLEQKGEQYTSLDLGSYKEGCYILSIELNREKKTWKILKD